MKTVRLLCEARAIWLLGCDGVGQAVAVRADGLSIMLAAPSIALGNKMSPPARSFIRQFSDGAGEGYGRSQHAEEEEGREDHFGNTH